MAFTSVPCGCLSKENISPYLIKVQNKYTIKVQQKKSKHGEEKIHLKKNH